MLNNIGIVIAAGGSGRRFGKNKLLEMAGCLPVFAHSIINFRKICPDQNIVLVCHSEFFEEYKRQANKYIPNCKIQLVVGGKTRSDSVMIGLDALPLNLEFAAIHDAARPLASHEILKKCAEACAIHGSGVAAAKVTDTIKMADDNQFVEKTINRAKLWRIQTPQVFRLKELKKAYSKVKKDKDQVTDDAEVMELSGYKIFLVENNAPNLKITLDFDLKLVNCLLNQ